MSEGSAKDVEKNNNHAPQTLEYSNEPRPARTQRRLANPAPIGLFAFGGTTFLLSMYNVHTRGIQVPNAIFGMALFGGGLVQLLAGMWEVPNGNTFGATAFSAYGSFWMSYATIYIPGSGIIDAFGGENQALNEAVGMYLMVWFILTVLFILPTLKRNLSFSILLSVLALAYLLLAIGAWTGKPSVNKAGGVFGIITGIVALYIGVGFLMLAEKTALFHLPLGIWSAD